MADNTDLTDEQKAEAELDLIGVRDALKASLKRLNTIKHESRHAHNGRELALAITNIETGLLWLKAVGHDGRWGE